MGMGVAGSYLMARLKDTEHEVVGRVNPIHQSIVSFSMPACAANNRKTVITCCFNFV